MPLINLELLDIIEYVGPRKRPWKEGEAVFKAGHVFLCCFKSVEESRIMGLCVRSTQLTASPHEINIELRDSVKDWKCTCSCKAGESGYCKHIVAVLIHINRCNELEELSCTDITQAWRKERKSLKRTYGPKRSTELCHGQKEKKVIRTSSKIDQLNFDLILESTPTSALTVFINRCGEKEEVNMSWLYILIFLSGISSLGNFDKITIHFYFAVFVLLLLLCFRASSSLTEPSQSIPEVTFIREQVQKVFANIENSGFFKEFDCTVPNDLQSCCKKVISKLSVFDALQVACETVQHSTAWMKERQLRITGSRCYEIYTYGGDSSSWESKAMKYFYPKGFSTKQMEYGKKEEANALYMYRTKSNYEVVVPSLIICTKMPWIGYSADGIAFNNGKPSHLVEIKCPYLGKFKPSGELVEECKYLESRNNAIYLKKKHQYYGQVQLGMAVLNLKTTDFIVYSSFSKSYISVTVPFDKEFAQNLICTINQKYFHHMIHVICKNNLREVS